MLGWLVEVVRMDSYMNWEVVLGLGFVVGKRRIAEVEQIVMCG